MSLSQIKVNSQKVVSVDDNMSLTSDDLLKNKIITSEIFEILQDVDNLKYLTYSIDSHSLVFKHIQEGGTLIDNNNQNIVINDKIKVLSDSYIYVDEGYKYLYAVYDYETGEYIERITWRTDKVIFDSPYYIMVEISDINETPLSDFSILEHLHFFLRQSDENIQTEVKNNSESIDRINNSLHTKIIDTSQFNPQYGFLSEGIFYYAGYTYILIPVTAGLEIKIVPNNSYKTIYTFLRNSVLTDKLSPYFAQGYSSEINTFEQVECIVPTDANYLYLGCYLSGNRLPSLLIFYGIFNKEFSDIENQINELVEYTNVNNIQTLNFDFGHIEPGGSIGYNYHQNIVTQLLTIENGAWFYVDSGYKYLYAIYDYDTERFVERIQWIFDEIKTTITEKCKLRIELSDSVESVLDDMSIQEHLHYEIATTVYTVKEYIDEKTSNQKYVYEDFYKVTLQTNNIINVIGFDLFKQKVMTVVNPDKYSCWPRLGKLKDRLVCLHIKCLEHTDSNLGAIYCSVSSNSIFWTPKQLVIDNKGLRDGITGCGNDEDGNLLFIDRVGVPGTASAYVEIYKTTDGISFDLISTILATSQLGHCGDIIYVPTKGLMAFYGTYGSNSDLGYIISSDNGLSWTKVIIETVPHNECPMEMSAIYFGTGNILVVGRAEAAYNDSWKLWQMESSDYGETWTKSQTNIVNYGSTPSMLYNETTGKISLYIYNRANGHLEYREVLLSDIWHNPTNWPSDVTVLAYGHASQDAGNVTTVTYNNNQIAVYYDGTPTDCGIYSIIN